MTMANYLKIFVLLSLKQIHKRQYIDPSFVYNSRFHHLKLGNLFALVRNTTHNPIPMSYMFCP